MSVCSPELRILPQSAVPALPGATSTVLTWGDWASFQARACSRPPPPITSTHSAMSATALRTDRWQDQSGQTKIQQQQTKVSALLSDAKNKCFRVLGRRGHPHGYHQWPLCNLLSQRMSCVVEEMHYAVNGLTLWLFLLGMSREPILRYQVDATILKKRDGTCFPTVP